MKPPADRSLLSSLPHAAAGHRRRRRASSTLRCSPSRSKPTPSSAATPSPSSPQISRCDAARAVIAAAAPAAVRRVRPPPPPPLRRPKMGGAAVYGHPATRRARRAHARVPERGGAQPTSTTPPRPSQPALATVTSARRHRWPTRQFFFPFHNFFLP